MAYPIRRLTILSAALAFALPAGSSLAQDHGAKVQATHRKALVLDSHSDLPPDYATVDLSTETTGQTDLIKLRRGQVDAAVLAVFVGQGERTPEKTAAALTEARAKLDKIRHLANDHPASAGLALTAADVERISQSGKTAIIIGFLNAYPFGADTAPIDEFYKGGVRIFGFTHAGNNDYADSSRPRGEPKVEWHGLSPVGKAAVPKLNRLGVIVDVSQLTSEGLAQVLALTTAPVIASHSGVKGIVDVGRNLSDAELEAIKANGGVVQVVAFPAYLVPAPANGQEKRPATVADLVDSIDYVVKHIGVDHVGIASDFNHNSGVVGFNNEGEAANVTAELVKRGYSQADINKIWGGNFLRVFKAVEAQSRKLGKAQ
jgi:membrane dipeptidase